MSKSKKNKKQSYFEKFSEKPVEIKPFSQSNYVLGIRFVEYLNKMLEDIDVTCTLKGSTLYKIAGKDDIEVAIYLEDSNWFSTIIYLINRFGSIGNLEDSYARFNYSFEPREIEIILMRGEDAEIDQKISNYLLNHPEELGRYEEIKRKYSYSKREYQKQKSVFFDEIVARL